MNVCHWSLFHHWSPPWLQVGQRTAEWGGPVQTLDRDTLGDLQGGRLSYALKLSRHSILNIIVIGQSLIVFPKLTGGSVQGRLHGVRLDAEGDQE